MTNEEAIKELNVIKHCEVDNRKQIEALDRAISSLRPEKIGDPLTLEQLREMDGHPVWVEDIKNPKKSRWAVVEFCSVDDFVGFTDNKYRLASNYGKTYRAYANPSFHIDRDGWTAEWIEDGECNHKPYRVRDAEKWKKYRCSKCGYKAGRNNNKKFCPSCGKAMTPEAWAELEKRLRGRSE